MVNGWEWAPINVWNKMGDTLSAQIHSAQLDWSPLAVFCMSGMKITQQQYFSRTQKRVPTCRHITGHKHATAPTRTLWHSDRTHPRPRSLKLSPVPSSDKIINCWNLDVVSVTSRVSFGRAILKLAGAAPALLRLVWQLTASCQTSCQAS